jgi:hypothetical protein
MIDLTKVNSNCCACGKPNGFEEHGWINICPTAILQFANEDTDEPLLEEKTWLICQVCTRYSVAAWAREDRRKNIIKNPPPTPTNSPAGAGTVYEERLAAVA